MTTTDWTIIISLITLAVAVFTLITSLMIRASENRQKESENIKYATIESLKIVKEDNRREIESLKFRVESLEKDISEYKRQIKHQRESLRRIKLILNKNKYLLIAHNNTFDRLSKRIDYLENILLRMAQAMNSGSKRLMEEISKEMKPVFAAIDEASKSIKKMSDLIDDIDNIGDKKS